MMFRNEKVADYKFKRKTHTSQVEMRNIENDRLGRRGNQ